MEIFHEIKELLAFRGKGLVNNKLLERVNSLIYLRYSLSFTHDIDIPNKITNSYKH